VSYQFGPAGEAEAGLKDPVSVSDWTGFYIGFNGGAGWAHTSFPPGQNLNVLYAAFGQPLITASHSQDSSGGLFGGQAGYNWQYGRFVGGLEVDYDAADLKSAASWAGAIKRAGATAVIDQQIKVDALASVRARLGWSVAPDLLVYGTGGLGMGHQQYGMDREAFPPKPSSNYVMGTSATEFGWVAGGGIEYKLLENVLLRAEYLHYDFGAINNLYTSPSASFACASLARTTVDVGRGGLSYKFGAAGAAAPGLKDGAYASDWTGLYAGVHGGGGWANTSFPRGWADNTGVAVLPDPSQRSSGGLVGGHLGYNWQYERLVGGLELDFDAANIQSTASLTVPPPATISQQVKTDELASLRGRLGWEVQPNLLAYGTGGLALGHFQGTLTSVNPAANLDLAETPFLKTSGGASELGWVAGAGLEYKLADSWLLRAEYLRYDFGSVNNLLASVNTVPRVDSTSPKPPSMLSAAA
jgi:outer membrane immunogenic protein